MNKIISMLLILSALLLLFSACNSKDEETEKPTESQQEQTSAATEEPKKEIKVTRGSITGNTYQNDSLGITFTKEYGWGYYPDYSIAKMLNITTDQFNDPELLETNEVASVIDFIAYYSNPTTMNSDNVNFSIENLKVTKNENVTVEEYIEEALSILKEEFKDATFRYGKIQKEKLGKNEYSMMGTSYTINGVTIKQYMYVRKVGSYMVTVTITTPNDADVATIAKMFS